MKNRIILLLLYTHIQIHAECILMQWIKTSENFFRKIGTSHFIVRVRKGLLKVLLWEGVGDQTELQYIDPHSYDHQHCVFLVLQGCSTGGLGALSAGWWLSLPHLVSNFSGPQLNRGSQRPLLPGGGFPYHILSPTRLTSNSLTSCPHQVL